MTEHERLSAIAWEAHRRGLTYGQLAAALRPEEAGEIYKRWKQGRKSREALEMRNAAKQIGEWRFW